MHVDALGWIAASLMLATFSCCDARRLRPLSVATNLAFIGYGLMAGLAPVLTLHLLLLPVNLWRCAQAYGMGTQQVLALAGRSARVLGPMLLVALPVVPVLPQ